MVKHIIFNVILNVLIIASVVIGYYGYKAGNYYFIPLLCAAAFGLSMYYKIKHVKSVREEMRQKAEAKIKGNNKNKR